MSFTASTSQAAFLFRRVDCFAGVDSDASGCHAGRYPLHLMMGWKSFALVN